MANVQINENWQKMIITRFNQILFSFSFLFLFPLSSLSLLPFSPSLYFLTLLSAPPSSPSLFSHSLLSSAPSLFLFPLPSLCSSLSTSLFLFSLSSICSLSPHLHIFSHSFFLLPFCYHFLFSHSPLFSLLSSLSHFFLLKKMFKHIYNPLPFKYKLTLALVIFQKLKKYFSSFNLKSDAEIRQWFFTVCIFLIFK